MYRVSATATANVTQIVATVIAGVTVTVATVIPVVIVVATVTIVAIAVVTVITVATVPAIPIGVRRIVTVTVMIAGIAVTHTFNSGINHKYRKVG